MGGEQSVHKQGLAAGFRVYLNHRVTHRRVVGQGFTQTLPATGFGQALLEALGKIVHGEQTLEVLLHPRRQGFIGRSHTGEEGVATHLWNLHAAQHGDRGRMQPEGHVGMPDFDL